LKTCERITLISQESLSRRYYRLVFEAPAIANAAMPGQFIHMRCAGGWDPFLRRPISLHDADPDSGTITLLIGEFGYGTSLLRQLSVGTQVDALGPLGGAWQPLPESRTCILLGGGVGIPPLHFLAKRLPTMTSTPAARVIAVIGARIQEDVLCEAEFAACGAEVRAATDDGSYGFHGTAVDLLSELLEKESVDQVFTCGPTPMMRGVAAVTAAHDIPCQASLEERMACGLGACISCVVEVRADGTGPVEYQRVCTEGPVFAAHEVFATTGDDA
jgi:dihydroorotate dehydrogenase electron transfer subunit